MARPPISPTLRRTYRLEVPVHDTTGESGVHETILRVSLLRVDGQTREPLYGHDGLVFGHLTTEIVAGRMDRPGSALHPRSVFFDILPTAYFYADTRYVAHAGGRTYEFTMPDHDAHLIDLIPE